MYLVTPAGIPIPPRSVLERFNVHEPLDTRFQSCARLLQAIWREEKGLPLGSHRRGSEKPRTLGSRLAPEVARAGLNYLRSDIAKLVRRELAYRERGALIEEAKIWENLLSSSALVFNLFGPMKLDSALARVVLKAVFGIDAKTVDGVFFETSPGRGNDAYIGDHTALDVLVAYTAKDGRPCFVGIEVKYAENRPTNATPVKDRHLEVARRSRLFRDANAPELGQAPLRQFFAEHALCYTMVHEQGDFARGSFVVVSPTLNHEIGPVIEAYQRHLVPSKEALLPFAHVSLESVVAAIHDAGEVELGRALDHRYIDFSPVHDLVDDWEPHVVA